VGHPNGTAKDSEDTLAFASLTGIRPIIEEFPLERAAEGFERMLAGQAHFRAVLTTGCGAA
jgi:D-arabinose 1-dehydrogenase-like Zn-dependent alcohol dehydrogenase